MKKKFFFAAVALVALASCTSDDFIGENNNSPNLEKASDAIVFNTGASALTRAGDLLGKDAATALQNQFVVFGTKHKSAAEDGTDANDEVVFKNYVVEWSDNSAGKTASNSSNWEYVGKTQYPVAKVSPAISLTSDQAIKYWDYSATNGYTFYAIASKTDIDAQFVKVEKITTGSGGVYDKGYEVTITNAADLDQLYVSDRKPVAMNDYQKPVLLTFRNFASRVRVGFYETIPGYSVKIDKFYVDGDATAAVTTFGAMDTQRSNFAASLQNINKNAATTNKLTVTYYNNTVPAIENHVKLTPTAVTYNWSLELGSDVVGKTLATSSATPTWDKGGNTQTVGDYTTVFPFEGNTNPMLIKVDYTLTAEDVASTDNPETIKVTGATVVVPTQFVQWKSNFAYTYLFKISDNSNGYTGPTDKPAGLFPITFDAAVISVADDKTQETISQFEDYAVTTYSNGSDVTNDNEYKKSNDIYVVLTDATTTGTPEATHAIVALSDIGDDAGEAQVYKVSSSGSEGVSDATVKAKLMGYPNGIAWTAVTGASLATSAPAADGTTYEFGTGGALKFTPSEAGTYVYVYTKTKHVATTYAAVPTADTFDSGKTYYFMTNVNGTDVYYAAPGINAGNFETYKTSLYTVDTSAPGTDGVYYTKVIKIV